MLAVFVVVSIEMFFAARGAGHNHDSEWTKVPEETAPGLGPRPGGSARDRTYADGNIPLRGVESPVEPSMNGHLPSRASSPPAGSDTDAESDDLDALDPMTSASTYLSDPSNQKHGRTPSHHSHIHTHDDPRKLFLQCLLLEAGILFHSIFIGMAVSVATGTAFIVLLIAICFHQTFEGFALGSRIAALIPALFDASSPKPWLMALAYGTTTPVGQAIGIWMHRLYDPNSEVGLLMVGITNAISSGLLLFAGLVQLIAEDFLSDRSYETLMGRRRVEASLAVGFGGFADGDCGGFCLGRKEQLMQSV